MLGVKGRAKMSEPDHKPIGDVQEIIPANGSMPLNVQYARRTLTIYPVSDSELDFVASLSNSIHLTFVGMSFGALLTLAVTLYTVPLSDPKVYAGFVACTALTTILTVYFGIRAVSDYRKACAKLCELKRGKS